MPGGLQTPELEPTLRRSPTPDDSDALRWALVCHALGRDRARELLEGLSDGVRAPALRALEHLCSLPSPVRRALLATSFDTRQDAVARLRRVAEQASPTLANVLRSEAPIGARGRGPSGWDGAPPASAGVVAFARRLVREASS